MAARLPSGAIPWHDGGHTDPWDHVQGAMGLAAAGRIREAERAYTWSRDNQRADGSWAIKYRDQVVEDENTDSNFCAYLATGAVAPLARHGRPRLRRAMWPTVERALDAALTMQRPDGAVDWASAGGVSLPEALVTGNASIHFSLRCGLGLADVVGQNRADWELAAARLRHALDDHPASTRPSRPTRWTGTTPCWAERWRWPTPRRRSTRAGTTSSSTASVRDACRPIRGSPAPRRVSWRWHST
ncbi:hypothetical protein [Aeromicrobium sp. UC242_57]|uniref:hypothetical protein n=1 Tax=Aeromicrobium sp. UC242_57 TaxID=3374624 RepID=UPI0037A1F0BA